MVLLNIQPEPRSSLPQVMADGCCLPYPDKCFDIVFSNSTIEHVADQAAFAREAMRVGKAYWIQTPNKWFPVEPHLLCPFIHWLPRHLQRPLMPITPWGLMVKPNAGCCDAFQDSLHLLDARRLQRLFPGCRLIREMFGGITKSLIAYHE
ncbi:MAG TPA: methyltransferase domain-containing protein [Terriglobales bacterium]|nr:methyltransferase domain-containing protein [Terriglobales bacterium]